MLRAAVCTFLCVLLVPGQVLAESGLAPLEYTLFTSVTTADGTKTMHLLVQDADEAFTQESYLGRKALGLYVGLLFTNDPVSDSELVAAGLRRLGVGSTPVQVETFVADDAGGDALQIIGGAGSSPVPAVGSAAELAALSEDAVVESFFFNWFDLDGATYDDPQTLPDVLGAASAFPFSSFNLVEISDTNALFSGTRRFFLDTPTVRQLTVVPLPLPPAAFLLLPTVLFLARRQRRSTGT